MPLQFAVLASGSRGNSSLVRAGHVGLLVDCGLTAKELRARLAAIDAGPERVGGVLLTHTHGDHVNAGSLGLIAALKVPFHCHEGHRRSLATMPGFRDLDALGLVRHYDDRPFLTAAGLQVEPVELAHDGGPTYGFRIEGRPGRRRRSSSVGYLADTGHWSMRMADLLVDVDALAVEFNHDVDLQRDSGRAPHLIRRNLGDRGHLSNVQGAGLVAELLRRSRPGAVRQVVLLHLSTQCNRPELAIDEARRATRSVGRRVAIHVSRQADPYPILDVAPVRRPRAVAAVAAFPWEVESSGG